MLKKINKKVLAIHIAVWLIVVIIPLQFKIEIEKMYVRLLFNIGIFYFNYLVLVPYLLLKKKRIAYFLSVLALLSLSFALHKLFLKTLIPKTFPLRGRSLIPVISLVHILLGTVIKVYIEWVNNQRTQETIQAQKNVSELSALKNQLKPHFLFNSLNSIYWLTKQDSDQASEAVITLSELMRYMLYRANKEVVLLKDEIEYISNYIKLQRLRIAENQDVNMNIKGLITDQKISPLLFISYIENAFKFGTNFEGRTEVDIKIVVKEDSLSFSCVNLIGSRNNNDTSSGIGMQNTKDRLNLLYPNKHSLEIKEENNRFIVALNLELI